MTIRIADLAVGETARVLGYDREAKDYRQRLLAMGLTPGTEFSLARVAPLGDPVEIKVRGFSMSLRKAEAASLRIDKA